MDPGGGTTTSTTTTITTTTIPPSTTLGFRLCHFLLMLIVMASGGGSSRSISQAFNVSNTPMYAEQRLLGDLLEDYVASVRPCLDLSEPLHTVFGLTLLNILELNQAADTLDTFLVLRQSWHDARLQWNSSQYQGLSEIQLPADSVWTPDIFSYDNVDSDFHPKNIMVSAYASGHLIWSTPLRLRTTCRVDLRNFPFDTQTCKMYFASWVYSGAQINVTLWGGKAITAFVLKSDMMSKEWTVMSHNIAIRHTKHQCCDEKFPDVVVSLTLKRNPLFYVHVYIVPALLIGVLVPFHMLLPPDSCERMTLGSILLASLILMNLKLQDVLPSAHSQLTAVGLFYTLSLLWAFLAMVSSILVFNIHTRGPRRGKVPDTIRWIFLRSLKRLVCLGSDTYYPISDMETITMRGLDHPKTSFVAVNSAGTDRGLGGSSSSSGHCGCLTRVPLQGLRYSLQKQENRWFQRNIRKCSSGYTDSAEILLQWKRKLDTSSSTAYNTAEMFTKAMSRVPQQVTVVTTGEYDDVRRGWVKRGVTCSSFTSVSASPAIISFCLHQNSRMHEMIRKTGKFAVHILSEDQVRHGLNFSKYTEPGTCQFESIPHVQGDEGLPIILGSLAVLLCETHSYHGVGDHHVWYGHVNGVSLSETIQEPLIYFHKSFRSVGDQLFLQAFENATLPFEDWNHEAHLRIAWNYIKDLGPQDAVPYIKLGIQKYNERNRDKIKSGYHETITMFFIHLVSKAIKESVDANMTFEQFLKENQELRDSKLLFHYYSESTLFQEDARHKFIPPDKKDLP